MADTIHLDIVTPERVLFSDPAEMVTAPGTVGEFGVLPGHAAFATTLEAGEVSIKKENQIQFGAISGGFVEIGGDKITILADAAEMAHEIDVERAQAAKARAEETLKDITNEDSQYQENAAALKRADNRIKVAARKA
jgi:F-type H+-transporting ATPase subunit epsilon